MPRSSTRTPEPMASLPPPGRGVRTVTMLALVLETASTTGLRRWKVLISCAPATDQSSRDAATASAPRDRKGLMVLVPFGSLATSLSIREAHGFPPPPRDGFSIVGE